MLKNQIKYLFQSLGRLKYLLDRETHDQKLLALGTLLSNQQWSMQSSNLNDYEFKIFSEWGDDGIIQYLIKHVPIQNKTFIEFGVENYLESNTRFLMANNNWSGFVMDGSEQNMRSLKNRSWFFRYDLQCRSAWIDKDNINDLLKDSTFSDLGLLHIDLDGNDYFILEAIDFSVLNPAILIMEYNSVFGSQRAITVPYQRDFQRANKHYSNLYFGASLAALNFAAEKKGYSLIGCNLAGNNGYFLRNNLLSDRFPKKSPAEVFVESKFRESRDASYRLSFVRGSDRLNLIKGLEVYNVITGKNEVL